MALNLSLAVAIVSMIFLSSRGASALSSTCMSTLMTLAPCLDYINGKSSTPSTPCCSQLGNVVKSQSECLCVIFTGEASSFGIKFNQTQALTLPGACNVKTPPFSECNTTTNEASGATGSAAAAPSAPAAVPSPPPSTAGDSAAAAPSAAPDPIAHDHAAAHDGHDSHEGNGTNTTNTESSQGSIHKLSALSIMFATVFLAVGISTLAV